MSTYVVRRIIQMIPVLIGATFLIYVMVFALPGDPAAGKCGDRPCPPGVVAAIHQKYHLDDPLPVAYAKYAGNVLHGDFGEDSLGMKVSGQLRDRYPITGVLALIAIISEAVVGVLAGILTALFKGRFLDNLVLVSTLVVIAIPIFVIGTLARWWLGVKLGWVQPTVPNPPTVTSLILPGLVLGSLSMAYVTRLTRASVSDALGSDYVRTARAKGLSARRVVGVHALRNSLIPVLTFVGYDFGALLGGSIVTEGIFNIQGIGGYIWQGVHTKDGFAVVGAVTALVLVYLVINLIVDLLYGVLDPRISHD